MKTSEFGRGYAICLLMFTFHETTLDEITSAYLNGLGGDEDRACELWANGSSDHLYDLVRPRRGITNDEWARARAIADRAIDVGHGFRMRPRPYATREEMHRLCDEARSLIRAAAERAELTKATTFTEAWALDKHLGLRPLRGRAATCEEPHKERL